MSTISSKPEPGMQQIDLMTLPLAKLTQLKMQLTQVLLLLKYFNLTFCSVSFSLTRNEVCVGVWYN